MRRAPVTGFCRRKRAHAHYGRHPPRDESWLRAEGARMTDVTDHIVTVLTVASVAIFATVAFITWYFLEPKESISCCTEPLPVR
jgi:hypothetical protein